MVIAALNAHHGHEGGSSTLSRLLALQGSYEQTTFRDVKVFGLGSFAKPVGERYACYLFTWHDHSLRERAGAQMNKYSTRSSRRKVSTRAARHPNGVPCQRRHWPRCFH